jgi:hypothetical protein
MVAAQSRQTADFVLWGWPYVELSEKSGHLRRRPSITYGLEAAAREMLRGRVLASPRQIPARRAQGRTLFEQPIAARGF